jgi:hypothetical protein
MTISELIGLLGKYDREAEICTVKTLPSSTDFMDCEVLTKFGLQPESNPVPEIVGSILELDLVVLK